MDNTFDTAAENLADAFFDGNTKDFASVAVNRQQLVDLLKTAANLGQPKDASSSVESNAHVDPIDPRLAEPGTKGEQAAFKRDRDETVGYPAYSGGADAEPVEDLIHFAPYGSTVTACLMHPVTLGDSHVRTERRASTTCPGCRATFTNPTDAEAEADLPEPALKAALLEGSHEREPRERLRQMILSEFEQNDQEDSEVSLHVILSEVDRYVDSLPQAQVEYVSAPLMDGTRGEALNHAVGIAKVSTNLGNMEATDTAGIVAQAEAFHTFLTGSSTPNSYPFEDGNVLVLGPELIAEPDGSVLNWKGQNYVTQPEPK